MPMFEMEISVALVVALAVRLLVPFLIFKWRIVGFLLAAATDATDVVLLDSLALLLKEDPYQNFNYQFFDKWLDMYYLTFAMIVSLSWKNVLARNTSIFLFAFRLVGLILFEITGIRKMFFFFPNLFGNFYIFYAIAERFFPRLVPKTFGWLLVVLFLLYIPKFVQEWVLHYAQLKPWEWIKTLLNLPF